FFPTGRLCLIAYTSYYEGKWKQEWREEKKAPLHVGDIMVELARQVPKLRELRAAWREHAEAERRRLDEQSQRWLAEQIRQRQQKAVSESQAELAEIADR